MGGSARLDKSILGDALVGVVDDIRRSIHGALGTRPWRVFIITRRWSGRKVGEGTATDGVVELDPTPKLTKSDSHRAGPGGLEETDSITLTGVSLSYTEDELWPNGSTSIEIVYRVEEAHGQGQAPNYYTVVDCTPRRGDQAGDASDWKIELTQVHPLSPLDGTDA